MRPDAVEVLPSLVYGTYCESQITAPTNIGAIVAVLVW